MNLGNTSNNLENIFSFLIKMLEATLNKTFTSEEKRDLKSLILKQGTSSESLKKYIMTLLDKKSDETVAIDVITSFLEISQNLTCGFEDFSPKKAGGTFVKSPNKSPRMQSRIPVKSPNHTRLDWI